MHLTHLMPPVIVFRIWEIFSTVINLTHRIAATAGRSRANPFARPGHWLLNWAQAPTQLQPKALIVFIHRVFLQRGGDSSTFLLLFQLRLHRSCSTQAQQLWFQRISNEPHTVPIPDLGVPIVSRVLKPLRMLMLKIRAWIRQIPFLCHGNSFMESTWKRLVDENWRSHLRTNLFHLSKTTKKASKPQTYTQNLFSEEPTGTNHRPLRLLLYQKLNLPNNQSNK